jgi:UDP-N-acetyl-D-glucosamine dehydrogenase
MNLEKKIKNRSAKIGIIGLGYVGLPLAIEFVKAGFDVVGFDTDNKKVKSINNKICYINDVDEKIFSSAVINNKLKASNNFSLVKELDSISICVPTPLNKQKNPDISHIVSVMEEIKNYIHKDMAIILESTTYPGSTRELVLPYFKNIGFDIGKNLFLCFSPERIDPGNKEFNSQNTPKILGGITKECTYQGKNIYDTIVNNVITVSSTETAEMVKLLENTFRAINIGLVNEIAIMCEKLGVNVWEVIDAASTKPFGYMKFTPGPGLGGHCIPIDPHYLSWKLKLLDYDAKFIKLASDINTKMPRHILNIISTNLNLTKKNLNGSNILIIGAAYKKDINDVRESPAIDIIKLLKTSGSKVEYYDPYVPKIYLEEEVLSSISNLSTKKLKKYDACVIITDHSGLDYELIYKSSQLIIDTRNVYKNKTGDHVKRLGQG